VQVPETIEALIGVIFVTTNVVVRNYLPSAVGVDLMEFDPGGGGHLLVVNTIISIQLEYS